MTLQCVLPINIFNEKIFAFLWFWMFCLMLASVGNFLYWASMWAYGNLHYRKVQSRLRVAGYVVTESERHLAHTFAHSYLRKDGAYVLDVIRKNSSSAVMDDLVMELWTLYTKGETNKERLDKGGDGGGRRAPGKVQGDILYI
ncbi:hypothetical protein PoB_001023800 [Plakobranchus ocellatus]|uniref:Innexin n=1 Tax=Plakobranchus ocellatus TaxID=259542 RepID=A0AAV3YMF7_9GAST|nr:hypothetical protein PoB_001023800 [Plakobranchus ocellatus]